MTVLFIKFVRSQHVYFVAMVVFILGTAGLCPAIDDILEGYL